MSMGAAKRRTKTGFESGHEPFRGVQRFVSGFDPVSNVGPPSGPTHRLQPALGIGVLG